jgi:iodotyrosine deiodinase
VAYDGRQVDPRDIVAAVSPRPQVPLEFERRPPEETLRRAREFFELVRRRRSVREFAPDPVPRECLELAIRAAGSAPSGAHRQPWRFVVVSDPALKREIRVAAEAEERESYERRMSEEWLAALEPLGTDWRKPFLETAPWIVVVFAELWEERPDGTKVRNYYVKESVGIACGLFIAALHAMGLATLTHTPSPMAFLNRILERPGNEKPFILFPIGYPKPGATVPALERKPLEEISVWLEQEGIGPREPRTGS